MKINKSMKTTMSLAALAVAAFIGSASAAITYVGNQYNMEEFTNDTGVGWRNASTAKSFDIDGDNIIGTDGYDFAGDSTVASLPSYVASVTGSGGHGDLNRGLIDDPTDPSGADIGTGWHGSGSETIVFQGNSLATETLRLSVLYDGTWDFAYGTQTFTLTQTVGGGSDSVTSPTLTLAGDGLDVASFDITGIQDGDTFQLTSNKVDISWSLISGVAFDTAAVPEPSTTALLGLGGLALILRRRK